MSLFMAVGMWITSASAMIFVHPGALDSRAELDFVKAKIKEGAEPWKSELDRIKSSGHATRGPHGLTNINSGNRDAEVSRDDAIAAYIQALLWYFTDDVNYARRSIAILNSWADLQAFTAGSDQDRLQAGWIGAVLAPAAEIMRLYPGWPPNEIANLQVMFKRAFYPQLTTASSWNGNVDLTQIDAMMAISVFNEDEALFRQGLARWKIRSPAYIYLATDGPKPKPILGDGDDLDRFWSNPKKWVDGLTQESCRDNGHHSQFALGSALHAAEAAWHQGVDIYSENQERYTAAMELLATQFLTGSMQGVCSDDIPTADRYDTWEVGYNHYHNRAGVALPNTRKLIIEQIRPRASRTAWNLNCETLTHADLPGAISPRGGAEQWGPVETVLRHPAGGAATLSEVSVHQGVISIYVQLHAGHFDHWETAVIRSSNNGQTWRSPQIFTPLPRRSMIRNLYQTRAGSWLLPYQYYEPSRTWEISAESHRLSRHAGRFLCTIFLIKA